MRLNNEKIGEVSVREGASRKERIERLTYDGVVVGVDSVFLVLVERNEFESRGEVDPAEEPKNERTDKRSEK